MRHAVVWSEAEDATLRANYPKEGGALFMRGKTANQVKVRASRLGIRFERPKPFPIGTERGAWVVIGAPVRVDSSGVKLPCRCKHCGTERLIRFSLLRVAQTQQCKGCALRQAKREGYGSVVRGFRTVRPEDERVQVSR